MSDGSKGKVVFAVDLGGTHLRAALVDHTGKILVHHKQETPKENNVVSLVDDLVRAAQECVKQAGAGRWVVASIVVPGTVDLSRETVIHVPNVPALDHCKLKALLETELGWPVYLENDANAAAVGETWMGAARGARNVICITLGTGVGGGVILDGKLWRGTDGSAGELGHTSIEPFGGPQCKCGNTGCLEMFA